MTPSFNLSGYRFKKKYGQNFIDNPKLLHRIAHVSKNSERVLEIGAGAGTLTRALADRFDSVVALEIDRDLSPYLMRHLQDKDNVHIHFADVLSIQPDALMAQSPDNAPYVVVANLPYYITTPVIIHLLENAPHAHEMVLMMQKEVAERLTSPVGKKTYGAITVAVGYYAQVHMAFTVNRSAFTPQPKVDSAVVHLTRYDKQPVQAKDDAAFRRIVKAAFGARRKTLRNALKTAGFDSAAIEHAANTASIDLSRRGETLSIAEFVHLSDALEEEHS